MDKLPTELLIQILEDLSYWDLKHLSFTCRRFKSLLLDKSPPKELNAALYQDITPCITPELDLPDLGPCCAHPCLDFIYYRLGTSLQDIFVGGPGRRFRLPLTYSSIANENAFSPSASVLQLHISGNTVGQMTGITIKTVDKSPSPVSVLDLMQAIVDSYEIEDPKKWWEMGPLRKQGLFFNGLRLVAVRAGIVHVFFRDSVSEFDDTKGFSGQFGTRRR